MAHRNEIDSHLQALLDVGRFKDYGPNGLQVEGRADVQRVVCGVTASLALIDAAIARGADTLLVHHGLFWRGQDGRLTGWLRQRVARLLAADINLFAFHLPLDAHPAHGNNAVALRLAQRVQEDGDGVALSHSATFGEQDLGFLALTDVPWDAQTLARRVEQAIGRAPVLVPGDGRPLRRIAWCTGGAQGYFEAAIAAGQSSQGRAQCACPTGPRQPLPATRRWTAP